MPAPTELLRRLCAALDGLRQAERTGAPFAATGAAMHGCGHDIHMAALVAVFRAARHVELPVPLVAVFQPSEEDYPSAALRLVEEGALDGVATVAAAHVHPGAAPMRSCGSDDFGVFGERRGCCCCSRASRPRRAPRASRCTTRGSCRRAAAWPPWPARWPAPTSPPRPERRRPGTRTVHMLTPRLPVRACRRTRA
jgi:hypothetical protein